mmetsp:Transcript_2048/g.3223  ORF Transcript_2048/g.3223 Transcript_2048/m.3223 type:complete len:253 (+) Transcript_2048:376-1134(+)
MATWGMPPKATTAVQAVAGVASLPAGGVPGAAARGPTGMVGETRVVVVQSREPLPLSPRAPGAPPPEVRPTGGSGCGRDSPFPTPRFVNFRAPSGSSRAGQVRGRRAHTQNGRSSSSGCPVHARPPCSTSCWQKTCGETAVGCCRLSGSLSEMISCSPAVSPWGQWLGWIQFSQRLTLLPPWSWKSQLRATRYQPAYKVRWEMVQGLREQCQTFSRTWQLCWAGRLTGRLSASPSASRISCPLFLMSSTRMS